MVTLTAVACGGGDGALPYGGGGDRAGNGSIGTGGMAGAGGGAGAPAAVGCHLSDNVIDCAGETLGACSSVDCTSGCSARPDEGCQIAPGVFLVHLVAKPPNDFYICDGAVCGTWSQASEAPCQVNVSLNDGGSVDYAIHDPGCP